LRYTRFPSVRLQPLGHLSAAISRFFESTTVTALSQPGSTLATAREHEYRRRFRKAEDKNPTIP
jgi:hypothetical protein